MMVMLPSNPACLMVSTAERAAGPPPITTIGCVSLFLVAIGAVLLTLRYPFGISIRRVPSIYLILYVRMPSKTGPFSARPYAMENTALCKGQTIFSPMRSPLERLKPKWLHLSWMQ